MNKINIDIELITVNDINKKDHLVDLRKLNLTEDHYLATFPEGHRLVTKVSKPTDLMDHINQALGII